MSVQNKWVRITSQSFDGPPKAEVVTLDEIYPLVHTNLPALTQEQIEIKLSMLLAQAAVSGFDIEITKHRDPTKGMGGYIPHIITRPDYKSARAKMAEVAALDGKIFKQPIRRGYVEGIRILADSLSSRVDIPAINPLHDE